MVSWQEMEKSADFSKNTICTSNQSANQSEYEFHILMVSWQEMENQLISHKYNMQPTLCKMILFL